MDQDEGLTAVDNIVTQFNTYEDFLDSQITTIDLYYLEVSARSPGEPRRGSVAPWRRRRGWPSRNFLCRLLESQALQVLVCNTQGGCVIRGPYEVVGRKDERNRWEPVAMCT